MAGYRSDPAFRYGEETPSSGWWSQWRRWAVKRVSEWFDRATQTPAGRVIMVLCIAVLVACIILRAAGLEAAGLFGPRKPPPAGGQKALSSGHVDFDLLIRQAAGKEDYRQAIRLWYLKTLQLLAERQYIHWKPGKTNASYVAELQGKAWKQTFAGLTRDFESCWYGEHHLDAEGYRLVAERFAGLHQQMN
jgi:hypothetical protein